MSDTLSQQKWQCKRCNLPFALSEIQVDHIYPIENTIPESMEEFINSFKKLHSDELQVLCKLCHKIKTREDVYKQKYTERLLLVSGYLGVYPAQLNQLIESNSVLVEFEKIIKSLNKDLCEDRRKRYESKLNKLKEKYL